MHKVKVSDTLIFNFSDIAVKGHIEQPSSLFHSSEFFTHVYLETRLYRVNVLHVLHKVIGDVKVHMNRLCVCSILLKLPVSFCFHMFDSMRWHAERKLYLPYYSVKIKTEVKAHV